MALGFKRVEREQQFLLPPDVRDWLPPGHLAWFVLEVVEQLDLSEIEARYRLGGAGRRAYHPAMLVALLLYAYTSGLRSSRRIERSCETDVACRVITANAVPDHATIARFRAAHKDALVALHVQVLALCVAAGLVDPRVVAVDSTKVAANASFGANLSREQLAELARRVFAEAAAVDAEEDARYGTQRRGDEPAPGWGPGTGRAERIRRALAQLDAQAEGRQDIEARQRAREAQGKPRRGRPPLPARADKPWRVAHGHGKKQARKANLTDPDSRAMKAPGGYVQGYSCHVVTTRNQIVLATAVTNDQNDNHALQPLVRQARQHLASAGVDPARLRVALADSGYWNGQQIAALRADHGVIPLVATVNGRRLRGPTPPPAPDQPSRASMHRRLQHPTARRLYQQRSVMVEPVFGQRKHNHQFQRFLGRGLPAANAEWTLEHIANNLTKLWRATRAPT